MREKTKEEGKLMQEEGENEVEMRGKRKEEEEIEKKEVLEKGWE